MRRGIRVVLLKSLSFRNLGMYLRLIEHVVLHLYICRQVQQLDDFDTDPLYYLLIPSIAIPNRYLVAIVPN